MLNNETKMDKTVAEIFRDRYVIPLYQRNFAWRIDEIQQLLQDVYDAYKNQAGNYYIGSLVVLKRHTGDYEVIDGQQRLTVISLIAILIAKKVKCASLSPILFYDSRPEIQEFLGLLCSGKEDEAMALTAPTLFYLKGAYEFLLDACVEQPAQEKDVKIKFFDDAGVVKYFQDHVVLVRNEMPEDTDVAAYFEIMNNRGEQLQKHEIVKAQLMKKIKCSEKPDDYDIDKQHLFAKIWDACVQMNTPIQRSFLATDREKLFGDGYDSFRYDISNMSSCVTANGNADHYSLKDVLDGTVSVVDMRQKDEEGLMETDVYSYASIIDFPNFLMHVLRLYLSIYSSGIIVSVPLNEKDLLSAYHDNDNKIDSMEFIKLLLFCRTVFDRFIVKSIDDSNDVEDGQRWVLQKPTKYSDSWKYISSFKDDTQGEQILKALSMLQVTFRQRIYKNWLFKALEWLYKACFATGDLSSVSANEYLNFLNGYMLDYFENQDYKISRVPDNITLTSENSYSEGTNTPHFLLNFIDYLFWCDWKKNPNTYSSLGLKDFSFKYWNTVEHHMAREWAVRNNIKNRDDFIHNLGNLCLISKSSNSRLSDRDVKEKVDMCGNGNLGPNRQIIYAMTRSESGKKEWAWGEKEIRDHYNEIVELLDNRREILVLSSEECEHVDFSGDMDALGVFIEKHFFDAQLPNGCSMCIADGDDAVLKGQWCGRYFLIQRPGSEPMKWWVGWRYGGSDKIAYREEIDFSANPSFAIQIPPNAFLNVGSSWYRTIVIGKWRNKELGFDIHSRDSWSRTAEEFKVEIKRLCE